jgi:glucose-1-phosphate cytidylyltransferase
MKVVILAGGAGTRLSEETSSIPKPMVDIGGKPMLWHIMKIYSSFGFNEFVILLGYKGYIIKEYFFNYFLHQSDITVDLKNNSVKILNSSSEPWLVTLVDTGSETMTGARIKKAEKIIGKKTFMLTYGDGVSNINLNKLVKFHKKHKKILTLTSCQPDGRFGALEIGEDNKVLNFMEKPKGDGGWINAGFFVCNPEIFSYLSYENNDILEQKPLISLSKKNEVYAYIHNDFWMPMDTLRDKIKLNTLWETQKAPWKIWSDNV